MDWTPSSVNTPVSIYSFLNDTSRIEPWEPHATFVVREKVLSDNGGLNMVL